MKSERKKTTYARSRAHLNAAQVDFTEVMGLDLVIGRREGYRIWDIDGRGFLDAHLNGGTYNLGHRHPEIVGALRDALDEGLDIGNHHFPSEARARLAERLVEASPGRLVRVAFASGGGEAVDIALKSCRRATGRRRVVAADGGYHGHTGLSVQATSSRWAKAFLCDAGDVTHVPAFDLDAMATALATDDVAAVILETIPATAGFPMPPEGYLAGVRELCDRHGALYVADEVQTGLGRTGPLWAIRGYGVEPDVLVTAKGLGGGIYPIAATLMSERAGAWLTRDAHGHVSTFGGAELGCRVAEKVLELTLRDSTRDNVEAIAARLATGLADIQARRGLLREVRQRGLVIGLAFDHPQGGVHVMRKLFDAGVWAIVAGYDYSALQLKPGLLWDEGHADELLEALDTVVGEVEGVLRG